MVMIEVELVGVTMDNTANTPVVVLRELSNPPDVDSGSDASPKPDRRRSISIFIGAPEATAIAFALEHINPPRPLTHDLMVDLLVKLGIGVTRIVITEIHDATFYAELHLSHGGSEFVISCRPSDALALAARVCCGLFVTEAVIDEAGVLPMSEEDLAMDPGDPDEMVEEFRQFIDSINPDDFAL